MSIPTDDTQRRQKKSKRYGLLAAALFFFSAFFSALSFSFLVIFGLFGMYCAFLWIYYGQLAAPGRPGHKYGSKTTFSGGNSSGRARVFSGGPGFLLVIGGMVFMFLLVVFTITTDPSAEEILPEQSEIFVDDQPVPENYSVALQRDPNNIDALIGKGNSFFEKESYDSALDYYDRILRLDARNVTALYNKSLVRFNQKDFSIAASLASQCVQIDPANTDALLLLGDCYQSQGTLDLALTHYNRAYVQGVRTPALSNMLAYIHDTNGNTVKAIAFYKETLSLDSSRADVYRRLAELEPERKSWYEKKAEKWRAN